MTKEQLNKEQLAEQFFREVGLLGGTVFPSEGSSLLSALISVGCEMFSDVELQELIAIHQNSAYKKYVQNMLVITAKVSEKLQGQDSKANRTDLH